MVRSIPPRTMRNIWDEEKKRAGSNPFGSIPLRSTMRDRYDKGNDIRQKYSSQINSHETSGTSGALYKKGKLEFQSVQGQPRNIYERAGHQGMVYPKKSKSDMSKIKDTMDLLSLDKAINGVNLEMFETDKKISIIAELCLENITNIFYDVMKEGLVVHANKDYNIPLKLKKVDTKTLEWSYNNGIIEVTFQKSKEN